MIYTLYELNERWVTPQYLRFLHANFLRIDTSSRVEFVSSLKNDLAVIEPELVDRLLRLAWREQLAGAWFAGSNGWAQFTDLIGDALLESRSNYVGQGYCFALARFADTTSVEYLRLYLDEYLPQTDCQYNQDWALGALLWLDAEQGSHHAQTYVQPGGLWEKYISDKRDYGDWQIETIANRFRNVMQFCQEQIESQGTSPQI